MKLLSSFLDKVRFPGKEIVFGIKVYSLRLLFEIDITKEGNIIVKPYALTNGEEVLVSDIKNYWDYGKLFKYQGKKFYFSLVDWEILFALREHNPVIRDDGSLLYPPLRHLLFYLQGYPDRIRKTPAADKIKFSDTPLEPLLSLKYKNEEIIIEAGYIDNEGSIIPLENLQFSEDKNYCLLNNVFYPYRREEKEIQKFLDAHITKISSALIPHFFDKILDPIEKKVKITTDEEARKITVIKEKPKLKVILSAEDDKFIIISVYYTLTQRAINCSQLLKSGKDYYQIDNYTWVKVEKDLLDELSSTLVQLNCQEKEKDFITSFDNYDALMKFIHNSNSIVEQTEDFNKFFSLWQKSKELTQKIEKKIILKKPSPGTQNLASESAKPISSQELEKDTVVEKEPPTKEEPSVSPSGSEESKISPEEDMQTRLERFFKTPQPSDSSEKPAEDSKPPEADSQNIEKKPQQEKPKEEKPPTPQEQSSQSKLLDDDVKRKLFRFLSKENPPESQKKEEDK